MQQRFVLFSFRCCFAANSGLDPQLTTATSRQHSLRVHQGEMRDAGAALRHFQETGSKYPLVVKLGTVTPQGAEVYSYAPDEDDLVLDPLLLQHLEHWGINMSSSEKSAKTMSELQVRIAAGYAAHALDIHCP